MIIDKKAASVEAAIEEGLKELNLTIDQVEVEIISKGGLFKKAAVRITTKDNTTATVDAPAATPVAAKPVAVEQKAASVEKAPSVAPTSSQSTVSDIASLPEADKVCYDFLSTLLKTMGLDCYLKVTSTQDKLAMLICGVDTTYAIGYRGEALDNIQYLTLLVANKASRFKKKLIIDAEGYREKRAEVLTELSRKLAYKVAKTNRAVELEPMNPFERRVIHTALQNDRYVTTSSEGTEPHRFVVISPKEGNSDAPRESSYDRPSRDNRDNHGDSYRSERRNSYDNTDITSASEAPTATVVEEQGEVVDMYDQSSKTSFKKTGAGKTRSFGNKQRRF